MTLQPFPNLTTIRISHCLSEDVNYPTTRLRIGGSKAGGNVANSWDVSCERPAPARSEQEARPDRESLAFPVTCWLRPPPQSHPRKAAGVQSGLTANRIVGDKLRYAVMSAGQASGVEHEAIEENRELVWRVVQDLAQYLLPGVRSPEVHRPWAAYHLAVAPNNMRPCTHAHKICVRERSPRPKMKRMVDRFEAAGRSLPL